MRIAIIGGTDYDEAAFEDFLYKLHSKYPDAVIVTGTAVNQNQYRETGELTKGGKPKREMIGTKYSAEQQAHRLLEALGHTVEVPVPDRYASTFMSGSDLQVSDILNGTLRLSRKEGGPIIERRITARADVIVVVGNPDSARAAHARDIWKRLYSWKIEKTGEPFIPLHSVAAPKKTKTQPKRKPKKKRELLAV